MPAERQLAELADACGLPLHAFRREHVDACIARALARGPADQGELCEALVRSPAARSEFRRSVAISHTGLFRDGHQFTMLSDALPRTPLRPRLRVWSAGCANGLELWSVAMLLHRRQLLDRSHLLGSDLLEENIAEARSGGAARSAGIVLSPIRMFFEVRDILSAGAPPGRWDLVLCRNVGIYLGAEARQRLHTVICRAVVPGGLLLLGRSEWLSAPAALGVDRVGPHLYRRMR